MLPFQKIFDEADEICGITNSIIFPQEDTTQFEAAYNHEDNRKQLLRNQIIVSDMEKLRSMVQRISLPRNTGTNNSDLIEESDPNQVVIGTYLPQKTRKLPSHSENVLLNPSVQQPYLDWEQEVRDCMKVDDSLSSANEDNDEEQGAAASLGKKAPLGLPLSPKLRNRQRTKPLASLTSKLETSLPDIIDRKIRKLPTQIAPYRCFDTDFIDVDEADDPLDRVFPHPVTRSSYALVPSDSEEERQQTSSYGFAPSMTTKEVSGRSRLFNRFTKIDQSNALESLQLEYESLLMSPDDEARRSKIQRDKQRLQEKIDRIKGVDTWLDTSTSLLHKSSSKRSRNMALHSRIPAMIASFNHSNIASSHFCSRPDLKEIELKYFHRPRLVKERDRPWQISLKQKTSINRKLKGGQNELGKIVLAEEDKQNLSLVYKDTNFVLIEYVEEFPPIMLNNGMASCIINYFRSSNETAQELDELGGEGSSAPNPSIAVSLHRKKSMRVGEHSPKSSVLLPIVSALAGNSSVSLPKSEIAIEEIKKQLQDGKCRLPRHVLLLWELNNTKRSYEHDANVPRQKIGSTKVLSPEEPSPFLGTIEVGELQKSFENNLFRSPLFEHPVSPTDFLLIRTKAASQLLSFSIREIPHLFLSGQLEPQVIVPKPTHKYTGTQEKFYLLAMIRLLASHVGSGISYQEIFDSILKYCQKEILAPHKYYHRQRFKDLLRKVGDEVRAASHHLGSSAVSTTRWFPKEFTDPEQETAYSADNMAKSFSPEDVCIQESCNAAEYRLLQSNITDIELMKIQIYLHFLHQYKNFQRERLEALQSKINDLIHKRTYAINNPSMSSSSAQSIEQLDLALRNAETLKKLFIQEIHRIDVKQSIARFILERLITAPWNTTDAFVSSVIKNDNSGKMNVMGKGDPSGIGEAFAYVRLPNVQATLLSPAALKKKKEEEKENTKLVGTDKDLRVLTKKDAIDLLTRLGVKKEEATRLGRWDRIHMIRSMVNELGEKGLLDENEKGLIKFARDPNLMNKMRSKSARDGGAKGTSGVSGLDIPHEEFQKICDDIWHRQKAALSERIPPSQQHANRGSSSQLTVASPSHSSKEARRREQKKLRKQETILGSPRSPSLKRSRSHDEMEVAGEGSPSDENTDSSDEDSDDSDLAEDIEKALSSRAMISNRVEASKTNTSKQLEQDKRDYESFNSMLEKNSAPPLAVDIANREKKKKITVGISGGNPDSVTPRASGVAGVNSSSSVSVPVTSTANASHSVTANLSQLPPPSSSNTTSLMQYPRKVVKRVTKVTQLSGKETIKIEFVFADEEVQRLEAVAERVKTDRLQRRTITALSHHPYCNKQKGSDGNYLDSDEEFLANNPSMSLQVGKIRERLDQRNQIQSIQSNQPQTKKEKQLTIKTQKALARQQQFKNDEEAEFINKVKSSKRSSLSHHDINPRLPRVALAIRLEKELMTIWNYKEYEVFQYPVDRNLYPNYYVVVQQPICLQEIRERVCRYQYDSFEGFMSDLRLMAENSERFNGKLHPVTVAARKIVEGLQLNIDHERQMIKYPEKDFFTKVEELIQQKRAFYRRSHEGGVPRPSTSSGGV